MMFQGIRVLEVSAWVMVPAAGVLLSDFGAEVIKVEHPRTGDPARGLLTGGLSPSVGQVNMMVEQTNRGKRSIGVDIAKPAGQKIIYELAASCDVFLTSLLPDVRRRLGIDVADLRTHNPSIIYAKADAVGPNGKEAGKPGFDASVFFGRAGILNSMDKNGNAPDPRPGFGDKTAALSLAYGIAGALFRRERTDEASVVDVSLLSSAMWVASSDILYSWVLDRDFSRVQRPLTNPLSRSYSTADGRRIMLSMLASDRWWPELCRHIGREDLLNDERFADAGARTEHAEACSDELDTTFRSAPLEEWRNRLASLKGPWEVVQNSREVVDDTQALANGFIASVDHPTGNEVRAIRSPVRIDDKPHPLATAPEAWQDTEAVLHELGYGWDEIAELQNEGILP